MTDLVYSALDWQKILSQADALPLATQHYPSRGQSDVQKLYSTPYGKFFFKKVSARNHQDCQVDAHFGSLAEREWWAFRLAKHVGLTMPELVLLDKNSTLQKWFDIPDAHIFKQRQGPLTLHALNVFECGLFDWVTGQIDRHDANYLYDYAQEKIILIDSAHSFLQYDGGLPDYLSLFETSTKQQLSEKQFSKVCLNLQNLSLQELDALIPLQKEEEKLALFRRWDKIRKIKTLKDLILLYRGDTHV